MSVPGQSLHTNGGITSALHLSTDIDERPLPNVEKGQEETHAPQQAWTLFHHVVGTREQRWRHLDAERLSWQAVAGEWVRQRVRKTRAAAPAANCNSLRRSRGRRPW